MVLIPAVTKPKVDTPVTEDVQATVPLNKKTPVRTTHSIYQTLPMFTPSAAEQAAKEQAQIAIIQAAEQAKDKADTAKQTAQDVLSAAQSATTQEAALTALTDAITAVTGAKAAVTVAESALDQAIKAPPTAATEQTVSTARTALSDANTALTIAKQAQSEARTSLSNTFNKDQAENAAIAQAKLNNSQAAGAQSAAEIADTRAGVAVSLSSTALSEAQKAKTAAEATTALINAQTAKTAADEAVTVAREALKQATNAPSTPATAQTVSTARTTAQTALTDAEAAVSTAIQAQSDARKALSNAELTAATQAAAVKTLADAAQTAATKASSQADAAKQTAQDVLSAAQSATTQAAAQTALTDAETALKDARAAVTVAESALDQAIKAPPTAATEQTVSTAQKALTDANTALTTARQAQSAADLAIQTAFNKQQAENVRIAQAKLNNSQAAGAQSAAEIADTQAGVAVSLSSTALSEAQKAKTAAEATTALTNAITAVTDAKEAVTVAGEALDQAKNAPSTTLTAQTVEQAKLTAQKALTDANTALTTARQAQSTAQKRLNTAYEQTTAAAQEATTQAKESAQTAATNAQTAAETANNDVSTINNETTLAETINAADSATRAASQAAIQASAAQDALTAAQVAAQAALTAANTAGTAAAAQISQTAQSALRDAIAAESSALNSAIQAARSQARIQAIAANKAKIAADAAFKEADNAQAAAKRVIPQATQTSTAPSQATSAQNAATLAGDKAKAALSQATAAVNATKLADATLAASLAKTAQEEASAALKNAERARDDAVRAALAAILAEATTQATNADQARQNAQGVAATSRREQGDAQKAVDKETQKQLIQSAVTRVKTAASEVEKAKIAVGKANVAADVAASSQPVLKARDDAIFDLGEADTALYQAALAAIQEASDIAVTQNQELIRQRDIAVGALSEAQAAKTAAKDPEIAVAQANEAQRLLGVANAAQIAAQTARDKVDNATNAAIDALALINQTVTNYSTLDQLVTKAKNARLYVANYQSTAQNAFTSTQTTASETTQEAVLALVNKVNTQTQAASRAKGSAQTQAGYVVNNLATARNQTQTLSAAINAASSAVSEASEARTQATAAQNAADSATNAAKDAATLATTSATATATIDAGTASKDAQTAATNALTATRNQAETHAAVASRISAQATAAKTAAESARDKVINYQPQGALSFVTSAQNAATLAGDKAKAALSQATAAVNATKLADATSAASLAKIAQEEASTALQNAERARDDAVRAAVETAKSRAQSEKITAQTKRGIAQSKLTEANSATTAAAAATLATEAETAARDSESAYKVTIAAVTAATEARAQGPPDVQTELTNKITDARTAESDAKTASEAAKSAATAARDKANELASAATTAINNAQTAAQTARNNAVAAATRANAALIATREAQALRIQKQVTTGARLGATDHAATAATEAKTAADQAKIARDQAAIAKTTESITASNDANKAETAAEKSRVEAAQVASLVKNFTSVGFGSINEGELIYQSGPGVLSSSGNTPESLQAAADTIPAYISGTSLIHRLEGKRVILTDFNYVSVWGDGGFRLYKINNITSDRPIPIMRSEGYVISYSYSSEEIDMIGKGSLEDFAKYYTVYSSKPGEITGGANINTANSIPEYVITNPKTVKGNFPGSTMENKPITLADFNYVSVDSNGAFKLFKIPSTIGIIPPTTYSNPVDQGSLTKNPSSSITCKYTPKEFNFLGRGYINNTGMTVLYNPFKAGEIFPETPVADTDPKRTMNTNLIPNHIIRNKIKIGDRLITPADYDYVTVGYNGGVILAKRNSPDIIPGTEGNSCCSTCSYTPRLFAKVGVGKVNNLEKIYGTMGNRYLPIQDATTDEQSLFNANSIPAIINRNQLKGNIPDTTMNGKPITPSDYNYVSVDKDGNFELFKISPTKPVATLSTTDSNITSYLYSPPLATPAVPPPPPTENFTIIGTGTPKGLVEIYRSDGGPKLPITIANNNQTKLANAMSIPAHIINNNLKINGKLILPTDYNYVNVWLDGGFRLYKTSSVLTQTDLDNDDLCITCNYTPNEFNFIGGGYINNTGVTVIYDPQIAGQLFPETPVADQAKRISNANLIPGYISINKIVGNVAGPMNGKLITPYDYDYVTVGLNGGFLLAKRNSSSTIPTTNKDPCCSTCSYTPLFFSKVSVGGVVRGGATEVYISGAGQLPDHAADTDAKKLANAMSIPAYISSKSLRILGDPTKPLITPSDYNYVTIWPNGGFRLYKSLPNSTPNLGGDPALTTFLYSPILPPPPPQTEEIRTMSLLSEQVALYTQLTEEFTLPLDRVTKMIIKVTGTDQGTQNPVVLFLTDKNGTRIHSWEAPRGDWFFRSGPTITTNILPNGGNLSSGKFTIGADLYGSMGIYVNIVVNATCVSGVSPFVNISRFGSGNNNKWIILPVIILLALFYYLYIQGIIKIPKF